LFLLACAPAKRPTAAIFEEADFVDTASHNQKPQLSVTMPTKFFEGDEVKIHVRCSDPDSHEFVYLFDWDGNGVFDTTLKGGKEIDTKNSWNKDGDYKMQIRAQDETGAYGDVYVDITVADQKPTADFRLSGNLSEGEWVKLDASPSHSPVDA